MLHLYWRNETRTRRRGSCSLVKTLTTYLPFIGDSAVFPVNMFFRNLVYMLRSELLNATQDICFLYLAIIRISEFITKSLPNSRSNTTQHSLEVTATHLYTEHPSCYLFYVLDVQDTISGNKTSLN